MTQYRKKPVAIEAIQFDGLNPTEIKDFVGENCEVEIYDNEVTPPVARIVIHTLEGDMEVSKGDYVIKGIKGEFYPCKPDIFKQTYESAETQQEQQEVDLEKELANMEFMGVNDARDIWRVARHFYELGQKDAANKFDEIEYNRQRAEEEMSDKTLNEAASEIVNESIDTNDTTIVKYQKLMECLVKAGAKWMENQGVSFEYRIIGRNAIENLDMIELENAGISWGDEVIVQIMKKEESK